MYHLHCIIQHKTISHPLKISPDQSPWPGLHYQLSTWPEKASIGGVQVHSQPGLVGELLGDPRVDDEALSCGTQGHLETLVTFSVVARTSLGSKAGSISEIDPKERGERKKKRSKSSGKAAAVGLSTHCKLSDALCSCNSTSVDSTLEADDVQARVNFVYCHLLKNCNFL